MLWGVQTTDTDELDFVHFSSRFVANSISWQFFLCVFSYGKAVDIKTLALSQNCHLIVPDGTWRQAQDIFKNNAFLHGTARQVSYTSISFFIFFNVCHFATLVPEALMQRGREGGGGRGRDRDRDRDRERNRERERQRAKGKTRSKEKGLWPRLLRISLPCSYPVQILNLVSDWLRPWTSDFTGSLNQTGLTSRGRSQSKKFKIWIWYKHGSEILNGRGQEFSFCCLSLSTLGPLEPGYHFACDWPTTQKLGCITNFNMLLISWWGSFSFSFFFLWN